MVSSAEFDLHFGVMFYFIFGIIAFALNSAEIVILCHCKRKRKCFEGILCSLSCANLLTAITFLITGAYAVFLKERPITFLPFENWVAALTSFGLFSTLFHLILMVTDRFFATFYPIKHRTRFTVIVVNRLLLSFWGLLIAFSIVILSIEFSYSLLEFLSIMVVTSGLLLLIGSFLIVKRTENLTDIPLENFGNGETSSRHAVYVSIARLKKLIVITIGLSTSFVVCAYPICIDLITVEPKYLLIFSSFICLNSVLNPLLYFLVFVHVSKAKRTDNREISSSDSSCCLPKRDKEVESKWISNIATL